MLEYGLNTKKQNFIPEGIEPPPKTIITSPELQFYVERFGELKDEYGKDVFKGWF